MVSEFYIAAIVASAGAISQLLHSYLMGKPKVYAITQQIDVVQEKKQQIKSTQQEIHELLEGKSCSYCGRNNKFRKNCEGCGAPCK